MEDKAASRQESRRLKTLGALLDAGAALLSERSIDAIPVNDIVARAGVAKGSFFNHFADKDAFARKIAARIRAKAEGTISAVNEGVDDPVARMARALSQIMAFALAEPREATIMLCAQPLGAEPSHPLNAGLRADLEGGLAAGRFKVENVEAAVMFVSGACQAAVATALRRRLDATAARVLARQVVELVLAGLGVEQSAARSAAEAAGLLIAP